MADAQANLNINIDTSSAIGQIKALQSQISQLYATMATGGATARAESAKLTQNLLNSVNATGKFSASMTTLSSSANSFTNSLEKNKLSMGEYFRYAGGASKTFGRLFTSEFNTIEKVARERVKTLQTQYIKMGRDANGAIQGIAVRPLSLDMKNLGTQVMMTAQKQQIFNQLLKQGTTNLLNFGKNTQWAGRQLMVGFTIPLTILGTTAAKVFMELEEQTIRFKRVYGEFSTSAEEVDKMAQKLRGLAGEFTKYGVAVKDTLAMAADAAAMGKMGNDLLAQVEQASRLAVLGGVDQQQALETTISLTNAFGVATEDLAGKISFLNAVENQTVVSIEDLTIAIPKAGPVVQQLGGDVEDLAFFLTAMKEGGINASEGANALKSGLASLINPSGKASEMLAGLGININSIVEGNAGNVKGIVVDFAKALDTLDPLNRARAIEQLFGKFQFSRISTLFQNVIAEGSQASRVLELTKSTTEELAILAERELGRVEESTGYKFKKAFEDIRVALAPVGEEFLKAVTPFIEFATKILNGFNNLGDGAKQFAVIAIAAVGVVAPTFLMLFGLVANGFANFIKGVSVLGSFLGKLSGQTKIVGGGINYMTQEQLESAAVAASLEQVHQRLVQLFTSEAGTVDRLAAAYTRAVPALRNFNTAAGGAAAGAAGTTRYNPFLPPKKYADGVTMVPGPKGKGDIVPAMLTPGEAVIPADQTAKYFPLIKGIIADNIPGYENGYGVVRAHTSMPFSKDSAQYQSAVQGAGMGNLPQEIQKYISVVSNLVAELPQTLNIALQKGTASAEQFKQEWFSREGKYAETARRGGLDISNPENSMALQKIENEIGERALVIAQGTQDQMVSDEILAKAASEVIGKYKELSGAAGRAAKALDERATSVGQLRLSVPKDEMQALRNSGVVTRTKGTTGLESGGINVGRVSSTDENRIRTANPYRPSGSYSGQVLRSVESDATNDVSSYRKAAKAATTPQDDPYMRTRDRKSPHSLAAPDGSSDAKAYSTSFNQGVKKNPLAPPTPPNVTAGATGRFGKIKAGIASAGNRVTDALLGTSLGQKTAQYFADTSGANIVDSKGNVKATARSLEELDAKINRLGKTASRASQEVGEDLNSDVAYDGDGNPVLGPNGRPVTNKQIKKEASRQNRSRRAGVAAGVLGTATMAVGMATQVDQEVGGINIGKAAQDLLPLVGGLSLLGPLLLALPLPVAAVVAGLGILGYTIFQNIQAQKAMVKESRDLAESLSSGTSAIEKFAEFAGTVTGSQIQDRKRKAQDQVFQKEAGRTTFGESFIQSEVGTEFLGQLELGISKLGKSQTINKLTNQLASSVISGALDLQQAKSIASSIGAELGDRSFGISVTGELIKLLGPEGENLLTDPLGTTIRLQERIAETAAKSLENATTPSFSQDVIDQRARALAEEEGIGFVDRVLNQNKSDDQILVEKSRTSKFQNLAKQDLGIEGIEFSNQELADLIEFNQNTLDAMTTEYESALENARSSGDSEAAGKLTESYNEAREEFSKKSQEIFNKAISAFTTAATRQDQTKLMDSATERVLSGISDEGVKSQTGSNLERLRALGTDLETQYKIRILLDSNTVSPETFNALMADGVPPATITQIGAKYGPNAERILNQISSITDEDTRAKVTAQFTAEDTDIAGGLSLFDMINNGVSIGVLFTQEEADLVVNFLANNEEIANEVDANIKEIQGMVDSEEPVTLDVIQRVYAENPEVVEAVKANQEEFEAMDPQDQVEFLQSIDILYRVEATGESWLLDLLRSRAGLGATDVLTTDIKQDTIVGLGRDYTKIMTPDLTSGTDEDVTPEDTGSSGSGTPSSFLDAIVKQTRDFKSIQQGLTEGWNASLAAIKKFSSEGGDAFNGLSNQMRKIKVSEPLIEKILGMDPDEYEKRKKEIFVFDVAGNITALTAAGQAIQDALNTATIAEFINEQQGITASVGNQVVALQRLTTAGASYEAAYRAVQNTALAAAIATARSSREIQAAAQAAMAAQQMMDRFEEINEEEQRKKRISEAIREMNKEFSNQAKILDYINKNRSKLSDAQISSILGSKDLQSLVLEPNIDSRALQEALNNANKKADLELKIKKLTVEGQEDIFQTGLSAAMSAFSAKEEEIEIKFKATVADDESLIKSAENQLAKIDFELDDYEAAIQEIDWAEEKINDTYEKRFDALSKVTELNDQIAESQARQLDLADALSRGDIAAAAKAAQEMRSQEQSNAIETQQKMMETAQQTEIARLRSSGGLSRDQINERILGLEQERFKIEENTVEPAQERIRLAELQRDLQITDLEVLGKTRDEWEAIGNRVDVAQANGWKFADAMQEALNIVETLVGSLLNRPVEVEAPVATVSGSGGGENRKVSTPITKIEGTKQPAVSNAQLQTMASKAMTGAQQATALKTATSPAVRQRIQASITATNYGAMMAARSLAMRKSSGGMIIPKRMSMGGSVARYSMGGKVMGYAAGGLSMGSDLVPAVLTPGEFVVRRPAVAGFGKDNLEKINRGTYEGNSVYNYNLEVNVKSGSNPNEIANTVMRSIKQVEGRRIRGNNL